MSSPITDPNHPLYFNDHNRALLTQCRHYDPHSIYGWHPMEEGGAVFRTRQLNAKKWNLSHPMVAALSWSRWGMIFSARF